MSLIRQIPLAILAFWACSAFGQSVNQIDIDASVMEDEVFYLIPKQGTTDDSQTAAPINESSAPAGSSTTQTGNSKNSSGVSAVVSGGTASIGESAVMAPPPGGGGGGGGSGPDPIHETYARQNIKEDLTPYGVDLLGEQFDLATGTLSFNHTDVVLPGNSGLDVSIRRTVNTAQGIFKPDNEFGDWELDVPKLEMTVSSETSGWWKNTRCTAHSDPGDAYYFGTWYYNYEYWNGLKMHIPGQGAQTVLDNPTAPVKTGTTTEKSTTQYWDISCTNIGGSEGFIATSPDGVRYIFDKLRYLTASGVLKNYKVMGRKRAQMLATRVEDRFGNWVNYNYTGNNLTSITSSDGRTINIYYGGNGRISSVVANGRTWTYGYTTYTGYSYDFLTSVTWPNGQSWSFDLHQIIMASPYPGLSLQYGCNNIATETGTITHPYGTKGTYTITETAHGRTSVPKHSNTNNANCTEPYHIQRSFDVMSLTQKKLEGPGLPTMVWNYVYSKNQGGWAGDGTNPLKTTRVNKPDGSYDIHHFDRTYSYIEGALKKVQSYSASGGLLQTIDYSYIAGPSRGIYGELFYENLAQSTTPRHQTQVKTTRGTDVFTTDSVFDTVKTSSTFSFGHPIRTVQYNNVYQLDQNGTSYQNSQTIDIAYLHDRANWELARERTRKEGADTLSENLYDGNNRVQYVRQYGVEVQEYAYNANGTVAWQEDALNNRVTTANWKRGIPQSVTYPDSNTHTFVVDNNGWIKESTDAKGYLTKYEYDLIGRMTKTEYPKNDGIQRLDKIISYGTVTSGDLAITGAGLVSGQYKQIKTRGDIRQTTYFDAMLRPRLARSEDITNSSLDRWTRQTFDISNRPVFRSFPSATAAAASGTNTVFDALGRTVSSTENVSPYASTSYTYLSGNKVQVTNPRGKQTTTAYFALGAPDQSAPTKIEQPANVTTTIVRNNFGEMTSATQAGTSPTVSATRTYIYDSSHRLCRQVDPETGSTAYSYNNNGQLVWYAVAASGSTSSCDPGTVTSGQKITQTYNSVGQLTFVNYPDTTPDLTYTYDANGNLDTLTSSSASWDYDYNAVNALREEKLVTGGQTFIVNYGFDTMDRLISVKYPSNQVVSITPNAYGEPEIVGVYASGFDYHPTGSISSLTYGNGQIYSVTQNARQLPWELKVMNGGSTVAKFTHTYDANANIVAIDDGVNAASFDRAMTYDDLDRLATASGFWGSGSYTYDALGNIRSKTEGGQAMTYGYQSSTNRLTAITGANARSFSYDAYGNVINNGEHTFTYNRAGNLTRTVDLNIDYRYDGHKRRVQEIDNNAPQTTYSMYSQSGRLMHKRKGGVSTDYIYAGSLLIAEKTGSTVDYMYTDLLGSPIAGNNGSAYKEHYRPWGDKKDHPIQLADDVGYTGHQSDIETGLTYMQARYYDPVVGRFMAVDPVEFDGGNPGQFGRYLYANNNPMIYVDPNGKTALAIALPKVAAICTGPQAFACGVIGAGAVLSVGGYYGAKWLINKAFNESDTEDSNAGESDPDSGAGELDFGKVEKNDQLGERGWTREEIEDLVDNTDPIGTTRDERGPDSTNDGQGRNDPASVYGSKDRGHVVVNDRTKEVVQVSDKSRSNWKPDRRIKWKE